MIAQVLRTEGSDGLNGRERGVLSRPMEALRAPFGSFWKGGKKTRINRNLRFCHIEVAIETPADG